MAECNADDIGTNLSDEPDVGCDFQFGSNSKTFQYFISLFVIAVDINSTACLNLENIVNRLIFCFYYFFITNNYDPIALYIQYQSI